jgi:hypothetical protein
MSTSMATYLAQNPENTPILSAENWRNLNNFILCICTIGLSRFAAVVCGESSMTTFGGA